MAKRVTFLTWSKQQWLTIKNRKGRLKKLFWIFIIQINFTYPAILPLFSFSFYFHYCQLVTVVSPSWFFNLIKFCTAPFNKCSPFYLLAPNSISTVKKSVEYPLHLCSIIKYAEVMVTQFQFSDKKILTKFFCSQRITNKKYPWSK